MAAPTRIHHINFVVRDLDGAQTFFEEKLGLLPFVVVDHDLRGARIARSKVGESWFVLVCPHDESSVPGQHLREHGEGFFLLSFGVDDLDAYIAQLEINGQAGIRQGILDWRIADLGKFFGASLQLTEDRG